MLGSLWMFLNVPAAYYFSYIGYTTRTDKPPCKVSIVRKPIPEQPWYLNFLLCPSVASLGIFMTVIFELHYVVTSMWRRYILGMFFALFVNMNLTIVLTALVSVLVTYLNLKNGNHEWWWRAFFVGAFVALWSFAYLMWMAALEF